MARYNIATVLIDIDKLIKAINTYSKNKNINYIIMNEITYSKFIGMGCVRKHPWIENCWDGKELSYTAFRGIPIAVCNSLETGDIELI